MTGTPNGQDFMRRSAHAWGVTHEASGVPAEIAHDAAHRTGAFYAPEPERTHP